MTKHVKTAQTHHSDEVVDVRVARQRQVPQVQTVVNTVEVPPVPFVDRVMDAPLIPLLNQATKHVEIAQTQHIDMVAVMPVAMRQQAPPIQTVAKTVEGPPGPLIDKVVEAPVIMQINLVTKHVEIPQIRQVTSSRKSSTFPAHRLKNVSPT